jgi:hypothetical protein
LKSLELVEEFQIEEEEEEEVDVTEESAKDEF